VDRFGIQKNTIEIEEHGIEYGHSKRLRVSLELNNMASEEELRAEIERLRSENENLKKPATRGQISMKVSEKGALSVYGLGRFPVTLYREQWDKLLSVSEQIREFIQTHDTELKKKE
jgi:hypothetical protein